MRLTRIAVIVLMVILSLSAVACKSNPPQPTPTPYIPPTSAPTSTHVSTPVPTPTSSTESIPLSVSIDYFWVGCAYGGNVQLVVVVNDEQLQLDESSHLFPPGNEVYDMGNFALENLNHPRVFHTESVQGKLKINVLAYHRDTAQQVNLDTLNVMQKMYEWYYGTSSESIDMLKNLVLTIPENDQLIGYYTAEWYPDESWGAGQNYSSVGTDGLRIWYSIWSDTDPGAVSEPDVENPDYTPDVTIERVTVPATVQRTPYLTWQHTLRIKNNEECAIYIDWKVYSSVKDGYFDSGTTTVPANDYIDISRNYGYSSNAAGPVELTYTISHTISDEVVILDTKSGNTVVQ